MSAHPLMASFMGAASIALISAPAAIQVEMNLAEAHSLMQRAEFQAAAESAAASDDFWAFQPDSFLAWLRPYVVKDGILQIPVKGVLLNNFPFAYSSYATGYEYIWQAFKRGMSDPDVKGIALVCDTPGGMVAGCFEAVDKMWALKQQAGKPVRGYASESAYSAGYAIISISDVITVSRTGGVGSIGVVTAHVDMSGSMEKAGYKITFVSAPKGGHKTDGNPYAPLPADVEARMQARIDELYGVFVSTVARNRPSLTEEEARATEALCFTATEAQSNKLADQIGSLDDSLAQYAADLESDEGDETMSTTDGSVSMADHETALATARTEGHTAGRAEGHAAGLTEGASAERARISAILASDEGKVRPAAAMTTAMKTAMSVEDAKGFLAALPAEPVPSASTTTTPAGAAGGGNPFEAAMDHTKNPNVGGGDGAQSEQGKDENDASDTLALAHRYGLTGLKAPASK